METEINNNQYRENKITIQCKMTKTMFRYNKNITEDITFIPEAGIDNPKFSSHTRVQCLTEDTGILDGECITCNIVNVSVNSQHTCLTILCTFT